MAAAFSGCQVLAGTRDVSVPRAIPYSLGDRVFDGEVRQALRHLEVVIRPGRPTSREVEQHRTLAIEFAVREACLQAQRYRIFAGEQEWQEVRPDVALMLERAHDEVVRLESRIGGTAEILSSKQVVKHSRKLDIIISEKSKGTSAASVASAKAN